MPAPFVPGGKLGAETGLADANWIADVRDSVDDYPQMYSDTRSGDGVNGVVAAGAVPYVLSKKPVYDGGISPYVPTATVNAVAQTLDSTYPPSATNHFYVNYNTGEVFFFAAPGSGQAVNIAYPVVRFSDQKILTNLYAGLRMMFPSVGKTIVDQSIQLQVNQWDYSLPSLAADPRTQVLKVEVVEILNNVTPFREIAGWKRTGLDRLYIPMSQLWAPTGVLRITYWAPYLNLGDLEPQLYHLPIWYAAGALLAKREARRSQEDTTVPVTQEGGQQPLQMLNVGKDYERRFKEALTELRRTAGPTFRKRAVPAGALQAYGSRS